MSINFAILGILNSKPQTGYDLKKIIQDSPFMPWSGNNNQVYKALLELLDEGYVTNEIRHQEVLPSKKIYTITDEGKEELKKWLLSEPEPPELKKMFLVQLACSELLSDEEIDLMLSNYESNIRAQLMFYSKNSHKDDLYSLKSVRERKIFGAIYENIALSYESELNWVQKTRTMLNLAVAPADEAINSDDIIKSAKPCVFEHSVIEKSGQKYIKFSFTGDTINSEQPALDMIALCAENKTTLMIIQGELLNGDFRKLSTGLAAKILQKFSSYRIKAAVVTGELKVTGKFKDVVHGSSSIKLFDSLNKAENWILKSKGEK